MTDVTAGGATTVASEVCLACGLCCTGAIFDYGPLDADETHWLDKGLFDRWPTAHGFAFPCKQLDGTRCRIYDDRPGVCSRYRCEVQNGLLTGALSRETALQMVGRAVALVDQALSVATDTTARIGDLRRAFQSGADGWGEADPAGRIRMAPLRLALAALERHLDAHFRRPHQRQLAERSEQAALAHAKADA